MHTLTVQVQDSVFQEFLNFISKRKETIKIKQDEKMEDDPYFYERQKELNSIRENIKNGTSELVSFEAFESRADTLEKELDLKYAN
ncbi:MAG TPA: hypothetical protein EYO73_11070 [Sulfurimonas sp.]|nr:hypothetical protein [Sulfurimonas sp.]